MQAKLAILSLSASLLIALPAFAQVPLKHTGSNHQSSEDELDPKTIKPINWDLLKLPKSPKLGGPNSPSTAPTAEDYKALENYKTVIKRYYSEARYGEAEPLYKGYITTMEKVGAGKDKMRIAWQNYAELLRKLKRDLEADEAEAKARTYVDPIDDDTIAYALKEFGLGMSLDRFTRLTPPVSPEGPVRCICSCDPGQKVERQGETDKTADVVVCGYWIVQGEELNWKPYKMPVAGQKVSPDFRFIKDKEGYRLYEITTTFFASNFPDVQKAYLAKYGKPAAEKTEKKRTESGGVFLETMMEWDNGVSKIRLRNIDGTNFERARLRYVHRMLYLKYANRLHLPEDDKIRNAAGDL